jgi:hypothetical protein
LWIPCSAKAGRVSDGPVAGGPGDVELAETVEVQPVTSSIASAPRAMMQCAREAGVIGQTVRTTD